MPGGKYLNEVERTNIDLLRNLGMSNRQIASQINRSLNVVNNYFKKGANYGVKMATKGNSKLSNRQKNRIIQLASTGNFTSAQINSELGLPITKQRTSQIIKATGHFKFTKIPALKREHEVARLEWAKKHMNWTTKWSTVVFSDEKKFNLDGPDGFQFYWHDLRKESQFKFSRNFGGGSVMFWAGFSASGKTHLAKIGTRMDSKKYTDMLDDILIPFAEENMPEDFVFQQDNAAIHVSRHSLNWFTDKNITLLDHPARSPDLNPMENLWGIMARQVYEGGRQYNTTNELEVACRNAWRSIRISVLESLVKSMPNRVFQVILNKGKQIKN